MIEIISSDNFTEELWNKYFSLYQEIHKKYYLDRYEPGYTLSELRTNITKKTENDTGYENFAVLDGGNPNSWFYFTTWGDVLYFGFYVNDENVKLDLLKEILLAAYRKMLLLNYSEVFSSSYRKANKDAMISINSSVAEEFISSRLKRENMDRSFYDSVIKEFIYPEWKVQQFKEVPREYIDQYVECFNLAFMDMLKLSPINMKYQPLTAEQIISNSGKNGNDGKEQRGALLADNENKVAGFCTVITNVNNKEIIAHANGFTAVHPKYRGIGIGKYLKAKLYHSLLEENTHFSEITTNTKKSNIYINKINEEFGFESFEKGFVFKLTKEFLKNYLNLN